MKQFKYILIFFSVLCSFHTCANKDLENIYCNNNPECGVTLKKNKVVDETNYIINLIDSQSKNNILPESETNSTTESLSLYKINQKYIFIKEYLGDAKTMEFSTFQYKDGKPHHIQYYYIESSIDFDKRTKKWSGELCSLRNNSLPQSGEKPLLATLSSICAKRMKPSYINSDTGNDIFFDIVKILDGNIEGNMTAVALDSKDSDTISINDLGCKSNCERPTHSANYIGKLNGKIRIKLHLDFNDSNVTGYYYYDKFNKNIELTGIKDDNNLNLVANVQDKKEYFNGVINDGQFKGRWESAETNKSYPFSFYLMLIQ